MEDSLVSDTSLVKKSFFEMEFQDNKSKSDTNNENKLSHYEKINKIKTIILISSFAVIFLIIILYIIITHKSNKKDKESNFQIIKGIYIVENTQKIKLIHEKFNNYVKEVIINGSKHSIDDTLQKGNYEISIKIKDNAIEDYSELFKETNYEFLNLSKFNTTKSTNMEYMFYKCNYLSSIDLSFFDTKNVKNMTEMFGNCINLHALNLSSFYTPKILSINSMFNGCLNLSELDMSNFETSEVTLMNSLFNNCNDLIKVLCVDNNLNNSLIEEKNITCS